MNEQNRIQKEYETWDEAFRGLIPQVRQQSVRVAAYTQVLFVQACASSFGKDNVEWEARMQGQYSDLAYKCGLYHQLGKSLLTPEQQLWRKEFMDMEKAIYQTYPLKGRLLVTSLQEKGKGKEVGRPTKNIPWLMIRESCEQHMERWNGSGYPNGLVQKEISPIAQIVGLAKELDRLVSETKSENPFDEAYVVLLQQSGKEFSEELIEILKAARGKCRGIYRKYIQYTKTLPKTIPLVEKRKGRPMGLEYRMIGDAMYEAVPWLKGVLNEPDKQETLEQLEPMLIRTKKLREVMIYLIYEATDTILRMKNCQIINEGIVFPMPASFYKGESQKQYLDQVFLDQDVDMSKLLLTVPEEVVVMADKLEKDNLTEYIEAGIQLVLDDYHPEEVSLEQIQQIGFSKVRLAKDLEQELREETENELHKHGIVCVGCSVTGTEMTEEELIQRMLSGDE